MRLACLITVSIVTKYSFTNGIRKLSEAKIVRVKRLFSFGFFLYLHIALIRARILSF